MSNSDPRRSAEDGRSDQPATAVAADTVANRAAPEDADRARHAAPTEPDGPIQDSERRDAQSDEDGGAASTRVLPAAEQPRRVEDRRGSEDRPTAASPTVAAPTVVAPPATADRPAEPERRLDPRSVLAREKEEFGGMRFLLAFFGWLTATGLAVLLVAIAGGIFAAIGSSNGAANSTSGLQSLGLAGAIVTAVILFVAYYAGGYVAGRMARFSGAKQGVAVWLWAIIISVLAAIAGAIGSQFGLFSQVGSIAQVQLNQQTLTVAGIVGIVAALALSLVGAVLGGIAGMRFHRKVDRAAFGA
jgi:hypothetical protein